MNIDKSITVSRLQQSNYSAISQLPRHVINLIKAEGDAYLSAPQKCEKIWNEMRRNDFVTDALLNFVTIQRIFDSCRAEIFQMLKIQNETDFFELFDQDHDGVLNEDEQILVFSLVKEKIQQVANGLLRIQEYQMFKQLMKELRNLERNIANYQDQLRQKIYRKEKKLYREIGQERLDDFYDQYYEEFQKLEQYKTNRRNQLKATQEAQYSSLLDKLSKDTELLKVKPKKKLKDLQTQEKLVSLEERVEEALDFRKELKDLEKNEQERVYKVQQYRLDKQKSDLLFTQQKEREQLELKLQETEYKLIIQMKKDYDILLKKTNLHNNEINRIQGLATKNALKKGLQEGEAKRTKQRSKQQNDIIGETKMIVTASEQKLNDIEQITDVDNTTTKRKLQRQRQSLSGSPGKNILSEESERSPLAVQRPKQFYQNKRMIEESKSITQFYIKKKYGSDLPVNFHKSSHNVIGDQHEKIEKFLSVKKKSQHDILPPITQLYDHELNERKAQKLTKAEEEIQNERQHKKAFINQKLFKND
ncbi:hypothetical protein pb186bvf_006865 [Paramecium bursaria]